jgi:hypothetical protein
MTTTDYLLDGMFVLAVLRQARERKLDLRSFLIPVLIVFIVARQYVHTIPTTGNDLDLLALLAAVGIISGIASGLATKLRLDGEGSVLARVGWLAGGLLMAGLCARMLFAFAASNGAAPAIQSFSIAHHITAAAWPVALVAMALCEVIARLITVELRRRQLTTPQSPGTLAAGSAC